MKTFGFLAFVLMAPNSCGANAVPPTPAKVVRSFYGALTHSSSSLAQDMARIAPLLTERLNDLVSKALAADLRFAETHPGEVPPLEHGTCVFYGGGDCEFSSASVSAGALDGGNARVIVELVLKDRNHPKDRPYRWANTVLLKYERGRWAIDDIRYFDSGASEALVGIAK